MSEILLVLRGLRAQGNHGVLAEERRDGQTFVVDAVLTVPAPEKDDIATTIDYAALAHDLAAVVSGDPVDLIETLADRLAQVCLNDARVRRAEITVHKPEAPVGLPFEDVTVTVTRERG